MLPLTPGRKHPTGSNFGGITIIPFYAVDWVRNIRVEVVVEADTYNLLQCVKIIVGVGVLTERKSSYEINYIWSALLRLFTKCVCHTQGSN